MKLLFLLLILVNVCAFIMVGRDKSKSLTQQQRIPEVYFFFISVFFASLGTLFGMYSFHHKTRKGYFTLGLSLLFLEQAVLIYLIWLTCG